MATAPYSRRDGRRGALAVLMAVAVLITGAGLGFIIYCLVLNIRFPLAGAELPGAVFGAVAVFLGVRYILSTHKLRAKLSGSPCFNWHNFAPVPKKTTKRRQSS